MSGPGVRRALPLSEGAVHQRRCPSGVTEISRKRVPVTTLDTSSPPTEIVSLAKMKRWDMARIIRFLNLSLSGLSYSWKWFKESRPTLLACGGGMILQIHYYSNDNSKPLGLLRVNKKSEQSQADLSLQVAKKDYFAFSLPKHIASVLPNYS